MATPVRIAFAKPSRKLSGTVVVFAGPDLAVGPQARGLNAGGLVERAAKTAQFTGKALAVLDLLAPEGLGIDRLIVVGTGKPGDLKANDWARLGGVVAGAARKTKALTVLLERPDGRKMVPAAAADFALGVRLRAYVFDKYKHKDNNNGGVTDGLASVKLQYADPADVRPAWGAAHAVADGNALTRDLIHEPANVLGPVEFAERASQLKSLGVEVEVLSEKDLKKLKMNALLGVAQGSVRPPRIVIMRWNGGKAKDKPLCFIGKGVVFDTGGISIKPAGGMEDMKGDMGGAAVVTGLMSALAGRKAKINAVGIIGLVENMPDGAAQRPGDIVTAMSGKTIEVINTDAEGRLVLADLLAYAEDRFEPRMMIDLATLTGAIIVALGHHHAGMFASDDALANALSAAGEATGEHVWRMPLGSDYDKLINSKVADMKNVGGRAAGAVTAAQFLKRFVKETPWAHLDVAGTVMGSPANELNQSFSSGWGVRLLDRLVADAYEAKSGK